MVVATQTASGTVQTGPDSLKYASYLWQAAESPQFVRLGPNGSVYGPATLLRGKTFRKRSRSILMIRSRENWKTTLELQSHGSI